MFYGFRQFLKAAGAIFAALLVAFCVYLMHAASFSGGEATYYLYSASSQAEIRSALSLADLAHLKGESVVYVFESDGGAKGAGTDCAEAIAEELKSAYRAELCFVEDVGGTVSFYCYSGELKGGVLINGRLINLHIAVRADSVAVGTPIIFGGY